MEKRNGINIKEMCIFAMLGSLMFCSKIIMEALPNIHILGMLTITYTLVYRVKALIPIYLFVLVLGAFNGFALWWIPHLYLWLILWGVTMLLPKDLSKGGMVIVIPIVSALHGLFYGTLYAPFQAIVFHMSFHNMLVWIVQGIPFDIVHAIGNFATAFMTIPLANLLKKLNKQIG